MNRNVKLNTGFSLIELLVGIAIVAILASVAFSSYSNSMQKSRRTDAKSTLLQIAALQEKQYFQNNVYTTDIQNLFGSTDSTDGFYDITVTVDESDTGCQGDGSCFVLTATADATSPQFDDTACRSFTLANTGLQQAFDSTGAEDKEGVCW